MIVYNTSRTLLLKHNGFHHNISDWTKVNVNRE